jgi:hypothetical protein
MPSTKNPTNLHSFLEVNGKLIENPKEMASLLKIILQKMFSHLLMKMMTCFKFASSPISREEILEATKNLQLLPLTRMGCPSLLLKNVLILLSHPHITSCISL